MEFTFQYNIKPQNLWILTILNIYRSMMGLCNFIFTVSMILLAVRFWVNASPVIRGLIAAGIMLFPVFQPLLIYFRCRKIVRKMPTDIKININKTGITTSAKGESSHINFSEVTSVVRILNMLIIYTKSKRGFILSDMVLKEQGEPLYNFIRAEVSTSRPSGPDKVF